MSHEVRKGHCSVIFTQLAKWYQLKSIWNAFNKRPAKTNVLCVNPRVQFKWQLYRFYFLGTRGKKGPNQKQENWTSFTSTENRSLNSIIQTKSSDFVPIGKSQCAQMLKTQFEQCLGKSKNRHCHSLGPNIPIFHFLSYDCS